MGQPLVAPYNMGIGGKVACKKLYACPENPLGVRSGEKRGAFSYKRGVYVEVVKMRVPVTPPGTAEQQAAEGLLALASPL